MDGLFCIRGISIYIYRKMRQSVCFTRRQTTCFVDFCVDLFYLVCSLSYVVHAPIEPSNKRISARMAVVRLLAKHIIVVSLLLRLQQLTHV